MIKVVFDERTAEVACSLLNASGVGVWKPEKDNITGSVSGEEIRLPRLGWHRDVEGIWDRLPETRAVLGALAQRDLTIQRRDPVRVASGEEIAKLACSLAGSVVQTETHMPFGALAPEVIDNPVTISGSGQQLLYNRRLLVQNVYLPDWDTQLLYFDEQYHSGTISTHASGCAYAALIYNALPFLVELGSHE